MQFKPHQVKANLWIFVNSLIENPAFDSQTKETLTSKASTFGSKHELSEKFIKDVLSSGIIERILLVAQAKENAQMVGKLN
jgi:DNA topoisomerase II